MPVTVELLSLLAARSFFVFNLLGRGWRISQEVSLCLLLASYTRLFMRDIFTLFLHAIVVIIRLCRPGGLRSVVAESILMRHQVLILNRGRKRAPNPDIQIRCQMCWALRKRLQTPMSDSVRQ